MMIPARNQYFPGWRMEYSGFLMSQHYTHAGNNATICVDAAPEIVDKIKEGDQDGALLYFVQAT